MTFINYDRSLADVLDTKTSCGNIKTKQQGSSFIMNATHVLFTLIDK